MLNYFMLNAKYLYLKVTTDDVKNSKFLLFIDT